AIPRGIPPCGGRPGGTLRFLCLDMSVSFLLLSQAYAANRPPQPKSPGSSLRTGGSACPIPLSCSPVRTRGMLRFQLLHAAFMFVARSRDGTGITSSPGWISTKRHHPDKYHFPSLRPAGNKLQSGSSKSEIPREKPSPSTRASAALVPAT